MKRKKRSLFAVIAITAILMYLLILPRDLFNHPLSFVLLDKDGVLLGARIAKDGQWRFPFEGPLPDKYKNCVLTYEDKRFYNHIGFDIRALGRAASANYKARKTVSGGSTITMQTISLYRGRKSKNIFEKGLEIILATRLELFRSKEKILELYAANAPFGGNVVGIDAACWRYFNKDKQHLTWAEAALLAILPNSPSLIHPGKNRDLLLIKRNNLLQKMADEGILSPIDLDLSLAENLPTNPYPLPDFAPHLLERAKWEKTIKTDIFHRYTTTIDVDIQKKANQIAGKHQPQLSNNGVNNLAILIADIKTGQVLAYVGNSPHKNEASYVDIITAPRSPGSLLKPFLYHWAIAQGDILPNELLPDYPVYLKGFRPENYNKTFDGAVPADLALSRSLNVPFALLLKDFGPDRFLKHLQNAGFTHMKQKASFYGLSLILGGVEASLWDLCNAYRHMALATIQPKQKVIDIHYDRSNAKSNTRKNIFHPGASFLTLLSMSKLERPDIYGQWKKFNSSREISWKTGTSHGFRDAWAIGMDQKYIVGIWTGNATGEGRPGLIGTETAAPILFDVFNQLEKGIWFPKPTEYLKAVKVCLKSGLLATDICPSEWATIPTSAKNMKLCNYHQEVAIDNETGQRVHANCAAPGSYSMKAYFTLPPVMEMYYRTYNPGYIVLPKWKDTCYQGIIDESTPMQWLYPKPGMTLTLPKPSPVNPGEAVLKIAHQHPLNKVFWYLDDEYISSTTEFHQISIQPKPGKYRLVCVDEKGNKIEQRLQVEWSE